MDDLTKMPQCGDNVGGQMEYEELESRKIISRLFKRLLQCFRQEMMRA